ncbi:MAG: PAS domain-containing protein [Actinomycetales bacterium]|nr:PAS domain-containing protein [Actinomycetales bacterium]
MSVPIDGEEVPRPSPLRSTSMPTEPVIEAIDPSDEPIERQIVDLFFDRVPFGLAIFGLDGRLQRCNRTWTGFYELYFGAGPDYTAPGRHLNDLIPGNEEATAELFGAVLSGKAVRQAAVRIDIPGTTTYWDVVFAPLYERGELVGVLDVVTDATDRVLSIERLEARIRAFTAVSTAMTVDQPLPSTLDTIRDQITRTTAAAAASLVIWQGRAGSSPDLVVVADPAFGPGYAEAFGHIYEVARGPAGGTEPLRRVDLRRGARAASLDDPRYAPLHPFWSAPVPEWEDLVSLPLMSAGEFLGELHVHLPAGARFLPDDEDYLRAMADQAALAADNAFLFAKESQAAGIAERQRLARELHDSVSQALFSMTMHARTAERHLEPLGSEVDAVRVEVQRLHDLTRGALAEMRALIFELRPDALAQEGLGSALTKQAAALSAREQIAITVKAPSTRLAVTPNAEEHLYRIALEAMNNALKHAHASRIVVTIEVTGDFVQVLVDDDGRGFDPELERPGHLGLGTMRDRAEAVGGSTEIESALGGGTVVRVRVPASADPGTA